MSDPAFRVALRPQCQLTGWLMGEDYELLFSLKPNKNLERYKEKITKIGFFSDGSGVRIYDKDGNQFLTKKRGFSHF